MKKSKKKASNIKVNGLKLYKDTSAESFHDEGKVFKAILESILEGDVEAFHEILSAYLLVVNKEELSRKSKVPIATIRRMAAGANFNIDNLIKVAKVLNKNKAA